MLPYNIFLKKFSKNDSEEDEDNDTFTPNYENFEAP
jgi:hypothetical protein